MTVALLEQTSLLLKSTSTLDPIMEKIAICESGNPLIKTREEIAIAKNPRSTASGRFQFLTSSWEHYGRKLWGDAFIEKDVFDYEDNTELAYWVKSIDGYTPWLASKDCWQ